MSNWKGYEQLAEKIYAELSPQAEVKWNDRVLGRESGLRRQIDVSIRWTTDSREYLDIVQVKDWKKRADIKAIGEFSSVVQDVGASRGIMVCRSGFSKSSFKYARTRGIELHSLHDATSKDWSHDLTIPILWIDLKPTVYVGGMVKMSDTDSMSESSHMVATNDGVKRLIDVFAEMWMADKIPKAVGPTMIFDPPGRIEVHAWDANGKLGNRPTAMQQLTYTVNRTAKLGRFTSDQCRGFVDYLDDGSFTASFIPVEDLPRRPGSDWLAVDDPSRLAITIRGTLITSVDQGISVPSPRPFQKKTGRGPFFI